MPDRVDAAMEGMQLPRLHSLPHCLTTQPELRQLRRRHDPVLPPREPPQTDVEFVNQRLTNSIGLGSLPGA